MNLRQYKVVFFYMFQNIEQADALEVIPEGNSAGIHLIQPRPPKTSYCGRQRHGQNFAAARNKVREASLDVLEHPAGSASDFQELPGGASCPSKRPTDELVPVFEPEAVRLDLCQGGKVGRVIPFYVIGQLGGEAEDPVRLGGGI
jgi:hypothetical protein